MKVLLLFLHMRMPDPMQFFFYMPTQYAHLNCHSFKVRFQHTPHEFPQINTFLPTNFSPEIYHPSKMVLSNSIFFHWWAMGIHWNTSTRRQWDKKMKEEKGTVKNFEWNTPNLWLATQQRNAKNRVFISQHQVFSWNPSHQNIRWWQTQITKRCFLYQKIQKERKDGVWVDVDNEIVRNSKHCEIDIGVTWGKTFKSTNKPN